MSFLERTWAEINLDSCLYNLNQIKKAADGRGIMAIVKADAYGHGAVILSKIYEKNGVDWLAVSNIEEAIELRNNGIGLPILILGYTPPRFAESLHNFNISQALFDTGYAQSLSQQAVAAGVTVKVHLKLDTGMGRIGFDFRNEANLEQSADLVAEVAKLPSLEAEGVFMHFATADFDSDPEGEFAEAQYRRFCFAIAALKNRGINPKLIHCCNSAATILQPTDRGNLTRPGIILYGMTPSVGLKLSVDLKPAMSLKTVISMIKQINEGEYVSYGRSFKSKKQMTVATLPVGYADGYPRHLSNRGKVLVGGKVANIVGRVCMDQTIIDISNIENVTVGQEV
ncbi:MAG: alanine racemase, partial [Oscillospiraceae bacterium]|nr:alanine racemase [Oscillospiraceae bacterium]